jgi:predicted transposase YbfD/YdcC
VETSESGQREPLVVRLARNDEVPRFNAALDEHHFLGHHLFGRVLRYIASEGDQWVGLVGFGSAALTLRPRDRFIGWDEATKMRRLRYVTNNQRYCILPGEHRANLASMVLARTLRRVSADMEAAYGQPTLLVETFTDPARHRGTCYQAANFWSAGETSGYGRKNGSWVHHGNKKMCWLYPLHRDAPSILSAAFDHPMLVRSTQGRMHMVDLNTVAIDGERGLYERLCDIADQRKPRGIRHELASVLLFCAAAMLSGCHNPTEIAEWAGSLSDDMRLRLHARRSPSTGQLVVPSLSTVQRVLKDVDSEELDRIVCETVAEQVRLERARTSPPAPEPATNHQPSDDQVGDDEDQPGPGSLPGISVDGKSLKGAVQDDGRAVHLLSALTHDERVVISQREVDHKENEIVAFRPLLEDLDLAGTLVTADALHAQRDHAKFLVEEKSADYLLFVKLNQPSLYEAIAGLDEHRWSEPYTETGKGHGRIENRTIWVADAAGLHDFPHLAQVVRILREVDDAKTNTARHTETVYAVTSAKKGRASAPVLLHASRGHWQIENGLHWVRDATMREDASKVRSGSAPRALATMRNLVISVLRFAGATNIAKSLRSIGRQPEVALTLLGL